jgi:phytoene synthase
MDEGWGFPNPATPPGSSSYYALRFAPARLRDDLAACHGWRHQVRSVLDQVSDPAVATAKLAWWREELHRCFDRRPTHPLGKRLAALIERRGLPPKPFLDIAWSTESVLEGQAPRDLAELSACSAQDLGALFELELRIQTRLAEVPVEIPDAANLERVRRLGAYVARVEQIRDSGWLLRRGRTGFIPVDQSGRAGPTPADLAQPGGLHHLPRLLATLAADARGPRGRDPTAGLPASLRIRVDLADRLLDEIESSGFDVADQRIALTPIRKLWYAWRESRRG